MAKKISAIKFDNGLNYIHIPQKNEMVSIIKSFPN